MRVRSLASTPPLIPVLTLLPPESRSREKILRPYSHHTHHPAGSSLLSAVGEQQIGTAAGAQSGNFNVLSRYPCSPKLLTVGFNQIQKESLGQVAVARSSCRQEKQRIFLANRVGFLKFAE